MHAPSSIGAAPILQDDFLGQMPAGQPGDDGVEGFDLTRFVIALRRRWPLVVICCLIACSYALVRYSLTTKEFQATAMIQIERRQLASVALGGQTNWLEEWWNVEYYPTQYRLLRSRGMAERVIENLRLDQDPAFTGKSARILTGGDENPTTAADDDAEKARLASRLRGGLIVQPIRDTQLVELVYRSPSPDLAGRIANGYAQAFIQWTDESRTQDVSTVSVTLRDEIINQQNELETLRARQSRIGEGSDVALDPAGEALLARQQTLQEQYNQASSERLTKQAAWSRIRGLSDEALVSTIAGDDVATLRTELARLEDRYERDLAVFEPTFVDMISLKAEIDAKRTELRTRIQGLASNSRDRERAALGQVVQQEQALKGELRRLSEEAASQHSSAVEYANLANQISNLEESLRSLQSRKDEAEFASRVQESQGSNVRLVDKAVVPAVPFRPILRNSVTTSLAAGLFLGLGLVFLLEFLDRTIKSPEELEKVTGLPTLAVVPDINARDRGYRGKRYGGYRYQDGYGYGYSAAANKSSSTYSRAKARLGAALRNEEEQELKIELLPHAHPRLAVCEAYRSLRTALLLSSAEELKTIAITSAEPGEGKTSTTTNLAVVLAQMERRVLILDCDLRRPRMHKVFDMPNQIGVVNYLARHEDIEQQLVATPVPNLWVCTSGPIPPNPSELLASERMRSLLLTLRQRFDYVLLDTPPVLPVVDAAIVGQLVDGVVICARGGVLLRDHARACRERLRLGGLRLFGTVMNRFSASAGSHYSRRYYYGDTYEADEPAAPNAA